MMNKRLLAKFVDYLIVSLAIALFAGIFIFVFDKMTGNDIVATFQQVKDGYIAASEAQNEEQMNKIVSDNIALITATSIYTTVVSLFVAVFYFGFLGKKFCGSYGKKTLRLRIINVNNSEVTPLSLVVREPLFQILILNMAVAILVIYVPFLILLSPSFVIIYLATFAINKSFWNKLFKMEVVSEK